MNFKHPTISICCLIMGSFVAIMDDIMKLSASGNYSIYRFMWIHIYHLSMKKIVITSLAQ